MWIQKGFITQNLLYFIEKWNFMIDKKEYIGAILMGLSKAFDTINYKLSIAKLNAHEFSEKTPK